VLFKNNFTAIKFKLNILTFLQLSSRIESQNHRMVGVGRDLCGSNPTLVLKQGHLQQAVEDLVQVGLEYL